MSKLSTFSTIAATIDNIVNYGTPDGAGVVRFDLWIKKYGEAGLDGPAVLANVWQSTLYKQGVHNEATAQTLLGQKACEIAIKYGFIRGARVDRTGVQHTPECKIMWMLYRDDAKKPGVVRAAARGEYGWLRQTMIGVLEQVKIVYGAEILTSDGKVMLDVLREALIEAKAFWMLKGTRQTVDGYIPVSDEAKKYMARARAAAKRIIAEVEAIAPNGVLCSCGRTHGEVASTVEAPADDIDTSPADESDVPMSDVQAQLMKDASELATDASLACGAKGIKASKRNMLVILGQPKAKTVLDAAMQVILNKDEAVIKHIYDLIAS